MVCEKPDAARRIACALGNSNFKESGLPPVFSATDDHKRLDAKRNGLAEFGLLVVENGDCCSHGKLS